MKILITTDTYSTYISGVVTSIGNLREELESLGHEVRILTVSDNVKNYYKDGVYHIRSLPLKLYPNTRFPISFARDYLEEIIEWQPHIIHSQCEFFSFEFAEYISRWTGAAIVHTYHTLYEQYTKYILNGKLITPGLLSGFMKERLRNVKAIIAPTPKTENQLRSYGIENRIEIIPTGISLERFLGRITPAARKAKRREIGIDENTPTLISLGRLGFEKNVNELIDGFALVLKRLPEAKFLIVGDGPAREELEKQTKELELGESVIFTGMVPYDDTPIFYQLGDLFVCGSTSEAQGLTYVEAAVSGLAQVSRDDLCLANVIEQGKNGFSYNTVDELADYCVKLLLDEDFRKNAAEYNAAVAVKFGREQFGKSVSALYREVWEETEFLDNQRKHVISLLDNKVIDFFRREKNGRADDDEEEDDES